MSLSDMIFRVALREFHFILVGLVVLGIIVPPPGVRRFSFVSSSLKTSLRIEATPYAQAYLSLKIL